MNSPRSITAPPVKGDFAKARGYAGKGLKLISSKVADVFLEEISRDQPENATLAKLGYFWTGTMVAYPPAGRTFGHQQEYYSRPFFYVMDTREFSNVAGAALVFDNFRMVEDKQKRMIFPIEPIVMFDFPQESGWFPIDPETAVPSRAGISRRFLWRTKEGRVGPVVRAHGHNGWAISDIFLHHRMNENFSVVVTSDEQQEPESDNVVVFPKRGLI
ncbi:hypothetical protein GF318_04385 [Candidatus Micrarchaeota archaeon]|nr:hypothetical protein [Candidatus Micrarchaeota archaeon]